MERKKDKNNFSLGKLIRKENEVTLHKDKNGWKVYEESAYFCWMVEKAEVKEKLIHSISVKVIQMGITINHLEKLILLWGNPIKTTHKKMIFRLPVGRFHYDWFIKWRQEVLLGVDSDESLIGMEDFFSTTEEKTGM